MELPQALETVAQAYLVGQGNKWPSTFDVDFILTGESAADKSQQTISVIAGNAEVEEPIGSGNYWIPLTLRLRTPTGLQTPADAAPNEDGVVTPDQITQHEAVADILRQSVMVVDLGAALNLARGQTAFYAFCAQDRKPIRSQEEDFYESGFEMRVYCCGVAF